MPVLGMSQLPEIGATAKAPLSCAPPDLMALKLDQHSSRSLLRLCWPGSPPAKATSRDQNVAPLTGIFNSRFVGYSYLGDFRFARRSGTIATNYRTSGSYFGAVIRKTNPSTL